LETRSLCELMVVRGGSRLRVPLPPYRCLATAVTRILAGRVRSPRYAALRTFPLYSRP